MVKEFQSLSTPSELGKSIEFFKEMSYDNSSSIYSYVFSRCQCNPNEADYVFTTTHKAKGLEWPTVIITNDFLQVIKQKSRGDYIDDMKHAPPDEQNLLYVAMTRAKKYLVPDINVLRLLVNAGETFEKVTHFKKSNFNTCVNCDTPCDKYPSALGLSNNFELMDNPPGDLCMPCSSVTNIRPLNVRMGKSKSPSKLRAFLRYVVGPIKKDDFDEIWKKRVDENALMNQVYYQAHVFPGGMIGVGGIVVGLPSKYTFKFVSFELEKFIFAIVTCTYFFSCRHN